jgi:hypothetical protein
MSFATMICDRCGKFYADGPGEWNVVVKKGRVQGYLCPACQTPEENTEAEINRATLDYGVTLDGRLLGRPKI